MSSTIRRITHFLFLFLFTGLFASTTPAEAQVQGTSYTLQPLGSRVIWSDNAGLSNGYFYGGAVGFGFGEYLELNGQYVFGTGFETDFSAFNEEIFAADAFDNVAAREAALEALGNLDARDVNVRRYGAQLRLNLADGNIVPFVTAGTGVLRFAPDDLEESDNIYATAGVGLTFSLADRYTLSVAGEGLAYRYTPGALFMSEADLEQAGVSRDVFEEQTFFNPMVTASLMFFLGGREPGEMTQLDQAMLNQFRGGGLQLAIEPSFGAINFNDELALGGSQTVGGINAGLDFGRQVGMRAFYWRGLDDEEAADTDLPEGFNDLTLVGGELNLSFADDFAGSLSPYLIVGGGYLDVDGTINFEEREASADRFFGIGGVGLELPISRALTVQGAVRSLLMSNEDIAEVARTSSVHNSWMYTVGLNFNLGRGDRSPGQLIGESLDESRTRDAAIQEELAVIQARLDSIETARMMAANQRSLQAAQDSMRGVSRERVSQESAMAQRVATERAAPVSNLSEKTVTLPVPENGELYVRFGKPERGEAVETIYGPPLLIGSGGQISTAASSTAWATDTTGAGRLTSTQIREAVRQALEEQQRDALTADDLESRLREVESRLEQRIDRQTNQLQDDIEEEDEPIIVPREREEVEPEDAGDALSTRSWFQRREFVGVLPHIGFRVGEGPTQFLVGARADYRIPESSFRFMPEAVLGFGDGTSINMIANGVLPLGLDMGFNIKPYLGAGAGFVTESGLSGLDLVFNMLAGAEYTLSNGVTLFGEFNTQDLFDFNRIMVGSRFRLGR